MSNGPSRNTTTNGAAPAPAGAPAGPERVRPYAVREITIRARSPRGYLVEVRLRDVRLEDVIATEERLRAEGYKPED